MHAVQARAAVALLDALGIARAHWVGNSQGGQSAMVAAITYPERVRKFVMGGSHIGTGGDRYLMTNRPSGAVGPPARRSTTRAARTSRITSVHIDDESLVTDELVDYGHRFRAIDMLLTNFHLPRSTLLMLVAALAGRDRIKTAYTHTAAAGYRFFSSATRA